MQTSSRHDCPAISDLPSLNFIKRVNSSLERYSQFYVLMKRFNELFYTNENVIYHAVRARALVSIRSATPAIPVREQQVEEAHGGTIISLPVARCAHR